MKDIKAILADVELEDDAREAIIKAVNENYRTINEINGKNERIKELEEQNKALTEQVGNLEGDGEELEKLRQQIQEFTEADKERKARAEEDAKRDQFRTVFDAAVGEREFSNDIIRDSIFEKTYEKCSSQAGINAKDVIEEMTKDADGVWKNPQSEINKMPTPEQLSAQKAKSEEAAKKEIASFLFRKKE